MPLSVTIVIEGRPRPQKRPRVYGQRTVDPSAGEKQAFLLLALPHRPEAVADYTGPVTVDLTFGYTDLIGSADIDNLAKFVLDALNGWFYHDDRQIVTLHAAKVAVDRDCTTVTITYAALGVSRNAV